MTRKKILIYVALLGLAFFAAVGMRLVSPTGAIAQTKTQLVVSAAASLTESLNEVARSYQADQTNIKIRYNFASSGALQQQIVNGAPADIFISAAAKQMDALQQKNLLLANTRRNLLTNRLVLVVPTQASGVTTLKNLTDARMKRIAIGDPRSVPAGEYAQAALTKAGLWNQLKPKFVLANNVRQVLQFVEAGNADAGLVYLTDAKTTNQVKIAQTIPTTLHPPIIYPIAVLKNSRHSNDAKAFAQFLFSDRAQQVFTKYGFKVT